ncbi:MAG TPA: hypothetical protein VFB81_18645 [Myxococcales bacterium]|nr:hypothetical protein [Myxococcales bacterium]
MLLAGAAEQAAHQVANATDRVANQTDSVVEKLRDHMGEPRFRELETLCGFSTYKSESCGWMGALGTNHNSSEELGKPHPIRVHPFM